MGFEGGQRMGVIARSRPVAIQRVGGRTSWTEEENLRVRVVVLLRGRY